MIIFLDYDRTYTLDPDMWDIFIVLAKANKHQVYCLTMRYKEEIDGPMINTIGRKCEIVCTERKAKESYALNWLRENGVLPAPVIFIDDSPHWLVEDAG